MPRKFVAWTSAGVASMIVGMALAQTPPAASSPAAPGAAPSAGQAGGRGPGGGGRLGDGGFRGRGGGRGPRAADDPVIQRGNNSDIAHAQLLKKAEIGRGHIKVYFEGDSITRRWDGNDYAKYQKNWNENFFGWDAADFGWGADRVENILWRLENGELDGVNPKVIVLLGGTNNLSQFADSDANAADITKGLTACVKVMQQKAPDAVIVVTGIFPRNDGRGDPLAFIPTINKINDNLAKLADGKKIRYLNINDKLADKDGTLLPGMMNTDHLHPDIKGYQAWADALKPIFTEVLGPPAKTDDAPPPTGDPKTSPVYPPPATNPQ